MPADRRAAHAWGVSAEQECARYLEEQGYRVLALRVRTAGGEIDVVAAKGEFLIIVEVKARRAHMAALESITPAKRRRLARAAEALLAEPSLIPGLDLIARTAHIRFDVMAVLPGQSPIHLEDAWRPDEAVL